MSTEQIKTAVFATSPQMNALSIFVAVVLGSSLIEFHEILFPPKLNTMAFWGIVPCYWVGVTGWFGIIAWGRYTPYLDRPASRLWITLVIGAWTSLLAMMFFASGLPGSILNYLWSVVVLFLILLVAQYFRNRDTGLPEPFKLTIPFGFLALLTAATYNILEVFFTPTSYVTNWIFVLVMASIVIGYRVWMRMTHVWRPEEKKQS